MKKIILTLIFFSIVASGCGKSDEEIAAEKRSAEIQRIADIERAKERAIWDSMPGSELQATKCAILASNSVKNQNTYSHRHVYRTCMVNAGYSRVLQKIDDLD